MTMTRDAPRYIAHCAVRMPTGPAADADFDWVLAGDQIVFKDIKGTDAAHEIADAQAASHPCPLICMADEVLQTSLHHTAQAQ